MKKYYKLLFFFVFCTGFSAHKFYVGVTQCDYIPKQKALQITTRVFIDDLQDEINFLQQQKIELATEREPKNVDTFYKTYLAAHLKFYINGNFRNFQYIGKKYKGNAVIFFLEIDSIAAMKRLKVANTILIKTIREQKNIFQTKIYNQKKSFIFSEKQKIQRVF